MSEAPPRGDGTDDGPAWDIEVYGAMRRQQLPLAIDVIGDFMRASTGRAVPLADRRFADVTAENFAATLASWSPGLDIPLPETGSAPASTGSIHLQFESLEAFSSEALERQIRAALADAGAVDDDGIAAEDRVQAIMANEKLRELEGSLRGLHDLATRVSPHERAKLRVLSVTKAELAASFQERGEIEQSVVFRRVDEERYGMFGGEPCSLLLADFSFGHSAGDVRLLGNLARLAEAAMCPVAVGASVGLFGLASWHDLAARGLAGIAFSSRAHTDWRALRDSASARHVIATLPRIRSTDGNGLINGGYAVAARLVETFTATRGMNLGGELRDLGSSEVEFARELCLTLEGCGMLPVGQRGAVEPGRLRTLERTKRYFDPEKTLRAEASANLICVLWTLQFGRAVKCIARDNIGGFVDDDALEAELNAWLQGYVAQRESGGGAPLLAEARAEVRNPAGLLHGSGVRIVALELRPALPGEEFSRPVAYELTVVSGLIDY